MDFFYFDASALAKRYTPETGSLEVDTIFDRVVTTRLMCLTVGASEVAWILVRKRNDGRITRTFFSQALRNLRDEVILHPDFVTVTADDQTVIDSIGFSIRHSLNSTDAIVLASALQIHEELQRQGDRLVLVSSDQRLNRAAETEGLSAFNPETDSVSVLHL